MNHATTQAEIDFSKGYNHNPYSKGSPNWERYEQHFDTLCIKSQKLENAELTAGA